MAVLFTILKVAVVVVLVSSLSEAVVLSILRGWRNYDWRATGISLVDFLVREYPLRWLLPQHLPCPSTCRRPRPRTPWW